MSASSMTSMMRRFFSGTLLSRLTGVGRDIAMAALFGASPSVGAFFVAFRLSNLLRRFLAEGSLANAFIPAYEGARLQSPERACALFWQLCATLILATGAVIGAVEIGIFWSQGGEVSYLVALLFPSLLFIVLYSLNSALLLCHGSAFIASFAPAMMNICWIVGALFLSQQKPKEAMGRLAVVVLIGYLLQWAVTLPKLLDAVPFRWRAPSFSPEVGRICRKMALGMVGIGAVQINSAVDALFARLVEGAGPIYLWYAIRLEQLPLALFGIACISSFSPLFSRALKGGKKEVAQQLTASVIERLFGLMLSSTALLFLVGGAAVALLFCRGQFSPADGRLTTHCLWAYSAGLLPSAFTILFTLLFQASGDYRTPSLVSLLAFAVNLLLNGLFAFGFGWGVVGIASATTLSALGNSWLLWHLFLLRYPNWQLSLTPLLPIGGAIGCAALVASLLTREVFAATFAEKLLFSGLPALCFVALLWQVARLSRLAPLQRLFADFFVKRPLIEEPE